MADIQFNAVVKGLGRLRKVVAAVGVGVHKALGQGRIEAYLLERVKGRFQPQGSTPTAQKDPQGRAWQPVKPSTIRRRKSNRSRIQALYDTGAMANAVQIVRQDTVLSRLLSTGGGGFTIGVRKGHEAYDRAQLHNRGGLNRQGIPIPRRQFMGVGREDVKAIGLLVKSTVLKELGRA